MLTVEDIQNIQWSDPNHTYFTCDVKFFEFDTPFMGYGAYASDQSAHIQDIISKINSGEYQVDPNPKFTQEEWNASIAIDPSVIPPLPTIPPPDTIFNVGQLS